MRSAHLFQEYLQTAGTWLDELADLLEVEPHQALEVFRAVSHVLRDRLGIAEANQLAAQLPIILRGIFFEGWKPEGYHSKIHSYDDVLLALARQYRGSATIPFNDMIRSVFSLLELKVSKGEIDDVKAVLPKSMRELWPNLETAAAQL